MALNISHPDQDALLTMLAEAGFERCQCFKLSAGIVAAPRAHRPL